ncbi:hypothetical protein B0H11DRAFT_1029651 [Mycena galericulata]|nr:hypothetical protein B0H11DRAFT_1029651 [Mycena galericulata]
MRMHTVRTSLWPAYVLLDLFLRPIRARVAHPRYSVRAWQPGSIRLSVVGAFFSSVPFPFLSFFDFSTSSSFLRLLLLHPFNSREAPVCLCSTQVHPEEGPVAGGPRPHPYILYERGILKWELTRARPRALA